MRGDEYKRVCAEIGVVRRSALERIRELAEQSGRVQLASSIARDLGYAVPIEKPAFHTGGRETDFLRVEDHGVFDSIVDFLHELESIGAAEDASALVDHVCGTVDYDPVKVRRQDG